MGAFPVNRSEHPLAALGDKDIEESNLAIPLLLYVQKRWPSEMGRELEVRVVTSPMSVDFGTLPPRVWGASYTDDTALVAEYTGVFCARCQ